MLFATHFFELTEMSTRFPGIHNAHVSAREWGDDVIFLHKVEAGPADRAYGIHVARLAGVPKSVLDRANVLLAAFEDTAMASVIDGKPVAATDSATVRENVWRSLRFLTGQMIRF